MHKRSLTLALVAVLVALFGAGIYFYRQDQEQKAESDALQQLIVSHLPPPTKSVVYPVQDCNTFEAHRLLKVCENGDYEDGLSVHYLLRAYLNDEY